MVSNSFFILDRKWVSQENYSFYFFFVFIIIIIIKLHASFSHKRDSKSPQISKILLSILADLNYTLVWMVSIRLAISNTSSPLSKPLGIILSTPVTIGVTVALLYHRFLISLASSKY